MLGQDATVIVPETTGEMMRNKVIAAGGNVIVHGKALPDADEYVRALVNQDSKLVYVPPFDHKDIWEGSYGLFGIFNPRKILSVSCR
jgi:threonine dehydratase